MLFHHIGVACSNIDADTKAFSFLGYSIEGSDFTDYTQGVKGRFLVGGGPRMELLTPIGVEGVLTPWFKAGVKLYHVAYEVEDIARAIEGLCAQGARLIVKPVPAVAFEMRKIAFLMLPNMLMTELIEAN